MRRDHRDVVGDLQRWEQRVAVEAFGIEKEFLRDLLKEGAEGKSQLPEFQRGWAGLWRISAACSPPYRSATRSGR